MEGRECHGGRDDWVVTAPGDDTYYSYLCEVLGIMTRQPETLILDLSYQAGLNDL